MKIRSKFVSNSSSSSFAIIDSHEGYEKYTPTGKEHEEGFEGVIQFGWGPGNIYDIGSRINWAYLQALSAGVNKDKYLEMLKDIIEEHTGITEINWNISRNWDSKKERYGYIDHQSCIDERPSNANIFKDPNILKAFLFGQNSYIVLDNDNR